VASASSSAAGEAFLELLDHAGVLSTGGDGIGLCEDRPHEDGTRPWADLGTGLSRLHLACVQHRCQLKPGSTAAIASRSLA
jgi:hypothetical protein